MKFSDNEQTLATLMNELQEAIEHHHCAIDVRDWNMVSLWEEQIDILCDKIKDFGL
jgi:hypothetical protein